MSDSDKPPNQHAGCRSEAAAFVARMIGAAAIGSMLGLLHWLLLPIPALDARGLTLRSPSRPTR